jgi:hypothetical protein
VNRITDDEITHVNNRRERIFDAMKKLGIKVPDLAKKLNSGLVREMKEDGTWKWVPRTYRVQDAMFFYVGMKNARTYAAIIHGMGLTEEFVNSMITQLTPEQIQLTEIMSKELDIAWERLREALAKDKNLALGKESYYVPMRRYEETGDSLAANLVDEALTRTAGTKRLSEQGIHEGARIDSARPDPLRNRSVPISLTSSCRLFEQQEHISRHGESERHPGRIEKRRAAAGGLPREYGKEHNAWRQKVLSTTSPIRARSKHYNALDRLGSAPAAEHGDRVPIVQRHHHIETAPSFLPCDRGSGTPSPRRGRRTVPGQTR